MGCVHCDCASLTDLCASGLGVKEASALPNKRFCVAQWHRLRTMLGSTSALPWGLGVCSKPRRSLNPHVPKPQGGDGRMGENGGNGGGGGWGGHGESSTDQDGHGRNNFQSWEGAG